MRKEGAKLLGRPKMRNPDGLLVHPPKLAKAKKNVMLPADGATAGRANKAAAPKKATISAIAERNISLGGTTETGGATTTLMSLSPSSSKTNGRRSDSSPGVLADVYRILSCRCCRPLLPLLLLSLPLSFSTMMLANADRGFSLMVD